MKTVYSERGKIVVDDGTLSLVEKAVQKVCNIQFGDTSTKISVPARLGRHAERQKQPIINVAFPGEEIFGAETPMVDFGIYDYDGWETLIDFKDLRKLPDLYFSRMFIYHILNPHDPERLRHKEVEERHKKPFAARIYKDARREIRNSVRYGWYDDGIGNRAYHEALVSAARNFYKGFADAESLTGTIDSAASQ